MLEFLIDNIFAMLGGRVFQQTVATYGYKLFKSLLADLFLFTYEADFIQGLLKIKTNILSIKNSRMLRISV